VPIDSRVRNGALLVLVVAAVGVGTYSVPPGFEGDVYTLEVGWWNIRDFSLASRDADEITQIADCVGDIDVLAVGELNDPAALQALAEELGPSWEWAATSQRIGRSSSSSEYYGFVWDSEAVAMVGDVRVDTDPQDDFDREPAFATFRTTDDGLDFTVVCVHITWGSGVAARQREIRALPNVWRRTKARVDGDDDMILVGDFNRNVGDVSFQGLIDLQGVLRANEDTGPTVVTGSSTYDQVFLSILETREWTGEWDTFAFDEDLHGDDDAAAKLAVSDHRPVWVTLYWTDDDDD
jgi:endonuclease/exonuclease/phosphatase family metal-dependent hydrolase